MSLKAFHIVFVVASTVLAVGFGVWCIQAYRAGEGAAASLGMGIASLVLAIVLIWYGRYVLRKLRHISYL